MTELQNCYNDPLLHVATQFEHILVLWTCHKVTLAIKLTEFQSNVKPKSAFLSRKTAVWQNAWRLRHPTECGCKAIKKLCYILCTQTITLSDSHFKIFNFNFSYWKGRLFIRPKTKNHYYVHSSTNNYNKQVFRDNNKTEPEVVLIITTKTCTKNKCIAAILLQLTIFTKNGNSKFNHNWMLHWKSQEAT